MARSRFSFEKRRKELDKQKKKEAKRQARAERKVAREAGEIAEPVVVVDEFGNVVEVVPAPAAEAEGAGPADGESTEGEPPDGTPGDDARNPI